MNNLKQLTMAWILYCHDNDDELPPNVQDGLAFPTPPPNWVGGEMSYENYNGYTHDRFSQSTNASLLVTPFPGRIGPYAQSIGVFRCPSDKSFIILNGNRFARVRSYSMNLHLGHPGEHALPNNSGTHHFSMDQIDAPSDRWVFIDEHEDSIRGGEFTFSGGEWKSRWWADIPASRHAGSGVLSFADGHVEGRKWLNPKTRAPVLHVRQYGISLGNDNRDVQWLWLRTTTPEPAYMP